LTDWERVEKNWRLAVRCCGLQSGEHGVVYQEAKRRNLNAELYQPAIGIDRVDHHQAVVDGFKKDEPIWQLPLRLPRCHWICLQRCWYPKSAPAGLIQRLGRLNRRYCGHALDAMFYADEKAGFLHSGRVLEAR